MSESRGGKRYKVPRDKVDLATIKSLIADFASKEGKVREKARQSLAGFGAAAFPLVVDALSHPNPQMRWEAAKTLGEIRNPAAVPALVGALEDEEFDVRWLAAEALISIGDESVVEPLLKVLIGRGDNIWVQEGAHHVLTHLVGKDQDIEHHEFNHPKVQWVRFKEIKEILVPVVRALEGTEPSMEVPIAAKVALIKHRRLEQ